MTTGPYEVAEVDTGKDDSKLPCQCSNCDWQGMADATLDIDDCALTPGDPSPVGRCPEEDCGSLCYIEDALNTAAPDLLAALKLQMAWVEGQKLAGVLPKDLSFPSALAAIAKAERRP